jgi:hypothetical protein
MTRKQARHSALNKITANKYIYIYSHIMFPLFSSTEGIRMQDMGINKYQDNRTRIEFFYSIVPAVWSIGRKYDRNEFDILRTVHRDIFV